MDNEKAIERFRGALRLPTFWPAEADGNGSEGDKARASAEADLRSFGKYIEEAYPLFHSKTERMISGTFGVAYRWAASGKTAAEPVLLLSHYDIVPVEREKWSADPFGAQLKDGFIWARGALDTKNSLIAALEAAEALMEEGFAPKRDLWFAFGGDEERSGQEGAKSMADWFAGRGIRFAYVLDEGSAATVGILAGPETPLALIGIEEKGFLDIELSVEQQPGHASRPPKTQAVAVLGRALDRLSRRPFPWILTPTVEAFFRALAVHSPFPRSFVLSNARALGPLFFALAGGSPETAALMRTTVAMTQLEGSKTDNVMPSVARAVLNLRLIPGWTVDRAVGYVRGRIADPRVKVEAYAARAANDPVPANGEAAAGRDEGWKTVSQAIAEAFPGMPILPFLVTATTDSRHYAEVARAIYRFSPLLLDAEELARIHGHDERISVENFLRGIGFYRSLISEL